MAVTTTFSYIAPASIGVGALFSLPPLGYKLYRAYVEEESAVQTVKYKVASEQSLVSIALGVITGVFTEVISNDNVPLGPRIVLGTCAYGVGIVMNTLAFKYDKFPMIPTTYRDMLAREERAFRTSLA